MDNCTTDSDGLFYSEVQYATDVVTSTAEMMATLCSSCDNDTTAAANNTVRRTREPVMTWWAQLLWTTVFGTMVFTAALGNVIVMWIVLAHRRMRTVTNYFLVNLSLADLMMAVLNCLFNFIYMLHRDWWFGSVYCRVSNYVATMTVSASVFTLTGITFDRYLAIVRPLKPRMSKSSAHIIILMIWAGSMTLALPGVIYSTTISQTTRTNHNETHCIMVWPDGPPNLSIMDQVYNWVLFLLTYLVPMVTMICCYTVMGKELWGSKSIGELSQRQIDGIRSKRKVVRMFILIMVIFGLCWLPYHGYFIYVNYNAEIIYSRFIQHYYLAFYWFAMSNSMVNPLIYYWMNARFRQYFKEAVFVWRCFKPRPQKNGRETPPVVRPDSFSRSRSDDHGSRLNNASSSGHLNNKFAHTPCTVCQCCRIMAHRHHVAFSMKENNIDKTAKDIHSSHRRRNLIARHENMYFPDTAMTQL